MPNQPSLFSKAEAPRRARRHLMHVADAGDRCIRFHCPRCEHDSGWLEWDNRVTEAKRGIPCPKCNEASA